MYLGDLDLSAINVEDEKGTLTNARDLYFSGKTVTTKKHGADYYVKLAEQMIDQLKTQMITKAKAMCAKKGVTFDEGTFNKFFNNAKKLAVNSAVWGMTSSGKSFGGVAASTAGAGAIGAATGVTVGAGAAVGVTAASAAAGAGTLAATSAGLAVLGPVGWAVGGVTAALVGVGLIGFGHHSKSSLNTRTLLDTFAENFKQNYSNWVEEQTKKTA